MKEGKVETGAKRGGENLPGGLCFFAFFFVDFFSHTQQGHFMGVIFKEKIGFIESQDG